MEVDTKKHSEGFGGDRFCVQSPGGFSTRSYAEVFCVIHKRDIPSSLRCKTNFDWSTAMKEIDDVILSSLILYLPELTPRLH
jgi:hypothetical protein